MGKNDVHLGEREWIVSRPGEVLRTWRDEQLRGEVAPPFNHHRQQPMTTRRSV
jgi:hypothetical protein